MALDLITDRAQADVNYAFYLNGRDIREMTPEEVSELTTGNLKGSYDYTDRNRVELAVAYLVGLLNSYGYVVNVGEIKTDWTQDDVFNINDMSRYLDNVKAVKAAVHGTTALPETMRNIGYEAANSIERLLLEVEAAINRLYLSAWVCGEVYCGEGATI